MSFISTNRKTKTYRILESSIGLVSIGFLLFLIFLAIFSPKLLAIFLIIYSFFMVMKVSLHGIYTIYTYKNLRRFEAVNWMQMLDMMSTDRNKAIQELTSLRDKYKGKIDWSTKLNEDIECFKLIDGTKFADPKKIVHIPLFSIYDESSEILKRSLERIYNCGFDLDKIIVFVSQEARNGKQANKSVFEEISQLDWINGHNVSENNLDLVYSEKHDSLNYNSKISKKYPEFKNIKILGDKLNVIFTQHPDGLIGEIKGKASNEDWGARQASLFLKAQKIDPEMVLVTSLDSDSKVGENFFQMLSFRYCLTPDRLKAGFQPLPVYSNNFFEANTFPRLVATNTTIWHMILYSLSDELHFFANYSVPITVLQKVNFWVREVIAEDSLLFANCLVKLKGDFRVVPFYGTFEGDAVYSEDYFEAILNQYKQLQRWAWGGIESFPYKFSHFFLQKESNQIDLRVRIRFAFLEFINHFFWSTSPIIFAIIVFLPPLLGGSEFRETSANLNLWLFSQYFAWMTFTFLAISAYITFFYISAKALKNFPAKWYHWALVGFQWIISPAIYFLWALPALDVQIRGILGKYLGYWVTPKK